VARIHGFTLLGSSDKREDWIPMECQRPFSLREISHFTTNCNKIKKLQLSLKSENAAHESQDFLPCWMERPLGQVLSGVTMHHHGECQPTSKFLLVQFFKKMILLMVQVWSKQDRPGIYFGRTFTTIKTTAAHFRLQ
jgi:hypothetical protein